LELVGLLLVQHPVSDGAVLDSDGLHQTGLHLGVAHLKMPQLSLGSGQLGYQPTPASDWAGMEVVGHDVADHNCVFAFACFVGPFP
jgi:hypothetical protein